MDIKFGYYVALFSFLGRSIVSNAQNFVKMSTKKIFHTKLGFWWFFASSSNATEVTGTKHGSDCGHFQYLSNETKNVSRHASVDSKSQKKWFYQKK